MTDQYRRPHKVQAGGGIGKSIFPVFNVNVPMPSGTPVPPKVRIMPAGPADETEQTTAASDGTSNHPAAPRKQ